MPIGREVKLLISSIVLIALTVVLAIQYTDVCRLQAVTLNGQPVDGWDQKLGLLPNRTVIRQPVDSLATALLQQQGITRVDIQYRLPNMLKISTNNLDPICYMIDRVTGTFFGLDESGRVVPIDISQAKWEMPIFTGLRVRRMHDYTDDYRANLVISQLEVLKQTSPSLYQSIEEVDFSHPNYVGLGFSGRAFRLKVPADRLLQRFDEFTTFVSRYNPPMDSTSCFDMTYDDEIIRVGAVPQKKLPPIDTASINDKADFSDEADLVPPGTVEIPVKTANGVESQSTLADNADQPNASSIQAAESGGTKNTESNSHSAVDKIARPVHPIKPVAPTGSPSARVTSTGAKTGVNGPVAKKQVLAAPSTVGSTNAADKPAKVATGQGTKSVGKSHIVGTKGGKSVGTAGTKGTALKKSPAKKTKSKANQQK